MIGRHKPQFVCDSIYFARLSFPLPHLLFGGDMTVDPWPKIRSPALVIAHPGHELCVFGWMSLMRPLVHVLTDGSGHGERSRADSTACLLGSLEVPQSNIFAKLSDRALYQSIMDGRWRVFEDLLRDLAQSFIANDVDFVVADAAEGFNPAHDLCSVLAHEAACVAARFTGRRILNYEIRLTGFELAGQDNHDAGCLHLELGSVALRGKLDAALAYTEMRADVERAIAKCGPGRFRIECLARSGSQSLQLGSKPYYEIVGRQRVEQGVYRASLQYEWHMLPLFEALRAAARNMPVSSIRTLASQPIDLRR